MARTTRPPIVAVMGHIDHGKSSLLDYIRKANVTAGEAGGITQHVSAYEASHPYEGVERTITFLDTPGHEAFRALRSRGAAAADIAILVVAADEGVKPQTLEAYEAIKESAIPFVVAFTKTDKNGADMVRAQSSLLEHGIYLEGLGGDISFAAVSSKTGDGVPELLDLVLLTTELAEPMADPDAPASGFVLESSQDPKRGISATLIIKEGTLKTGTFAVAGEASAPVRFIEDFRGARISQGNPSQPVLISGWNGLPQAGMLFAAVATKKDAEKAVVTNTPPHVMLTRKHEAADGKTLLPLIIKADAMGSVEAIKYELSKLEHERALIRIISEGIGAVAEGDVKQAAAGGATIIAFHVTTDASARDLADRMGVPIETYKIIYELQDYVAKRLATAAPKITVEQVTGEVKVLKVFNATGSKQVLGAKWVSGSLKIGDQVKIDRRGLALGNGKVTNLQVARIDTSEIKMEGEFGLQVEAKSEIAAGDTLTSFTLVEA